MRAALPIVLWLASAAAVAQTPFSDQAPFLSKGWTFDEPDGAALYAHVCAACHQADGEGAVGAGSYPALKGDERIASTDYLLSVLLGGQHAMPALGRSMDDAQLTDLVNYVRERFAGLRDDPATTERVAAARKAYKKE